MNMRFSLRVALLLVLPFSSHASAQQQTAPPPPPPYCENNPGFNDFDFWVGEWNVYSNDGNRVFAGTNSITKHYHNCLIKEHWVSANGGGFSINFFNPVRDEWRQVWVANGYSINYAGGLDDDGAMLMEGEIDGYQSSTSTRFRGRWTAEENGDVIQRFETWDAESENWTLWFEGRYVRKETDPNPPTPE